MFSSSLRASRARSFATAAPSGAFNVAAINHGQPTSTVTVLVKGGTRYETKPGVAHALKNFAFKATEKRSALRTVRETELYGGVLSTSLSREHIAFSADFLPGNEAYFVDVLASLLTSAKFSPHEFKEDVIPAIESEYNAAHSSPPTAALELAHSLAFRTGLGSNLFASPNSPVTLEDVKDYASKVFSKENVAVIGTGIDEATLEKLVNQYFGSATAGFSLSSPATQYYGGETRVAGDAHAHGPQTVFIGYGTTSPSPELAVLSAYLDPTPSVKWSKGTSSLAATAAEANASITPVYLPYSDAALFGVLVQSPTTEGVKTAASAVVKALKALTSGSVKDEELSKAISKAKFNAAAALDGKDGVIGAIGSKILGGADSSLDSLFASLDKVNVSALAKSASTLTSTKPTYVAVGNVAALPYADELGL